MRAVCAWGEGPDVLVVLEGTPIVIYENPYGFERWEHGVVSKGSFDLNMKEALALAYSLIEATKQAIELEEGWREAGKNELQI